MATRYSCSFCSSVYSLQTVVSLNVVTVTTLDVCLELYAIQK